MKAQFFEILSLLAIIAYFVPLSILLFKKLWKDGSLLLFAMYWSLGGIVNLFNKVPDISNRTLEIIDVGYYMMAIPFVLAIFHYSTISRSLKNLIGVILPTYIVVELVNSIFNGLYYNSIKYILGLGLILSLVVIVWEIILHLQKLEHSNRERAMIFIYSAVLFEYGTYVIIYIFNFYISSTDSKDSLLIHYISSLISVLIASSGFLLRGKAERRVLYSR